MKCLVSVVATASAVALLVLHSTPAAAQPGAPPPNPKIETSYVPPTKNLKLTPVYQRLADRKVLETLRQFLAPLQLPDKLVVKFDECNGDKVTRVRQRRTATICYEYVADIESLAPRSEVLLAQQGTVTPENAIVGPVVQAVLHEVTIAVFDLLELPVWGRADDAADRITAFIMLQFGKDVAWNTVLGLAWYMSGNALGTPDFSDERGVIAQRYYTTLCISYGGQLRQNLETKFEYFVAWPGWNPGGNLPAERAASCVEEFDAVKRAFDDLILPRIDGPSLERVRRLITWSNLVGGR